MPNAPPIACRCGARRQAGQPCAKCGMGKRKTPAKGGWQSSPLYRTARWQKRREAQLIADPLCTECSKEGRCVAATVADHIVPWTTEEEFWEGELQSLCFTHHGRKSQGERKSIRT